MSLVSRGEERGRYRVRHLLLAALALSALFVGVSLARFIDGDEGFYLVAARLVGEGKRPYADFFYLQMPLLPYAFAAWRSVFGEGWYAARILAALLASGIGLLLFHHVVQRTGSAVLGGVALLLFALSGLSLGWFSVVKTYGLSELLLFASYVLASSAGANPRRRGALLASGVLLGLATSVRLYLIVVAPCVALYLLRKPGSGGARLRACAGFAAGVALGLLPCAPFLLRDREAFVFDAFTFHSMRYPHGMIGEFGQKWETFLGVLGLRAPDGPGGIQFLALVAAGAAGFFLPGAPRNSLARSLWVALGATSLLPNPTFTQYFCLLVPFLSIGVAEHLAVAWPPKRTGSAALALGCLAYAALGLLDLRRYVSTGERVPVIASRADAVNWTIRTVEEVGRGVDQAGVEEGASWWPGYFASTRTRIVPEMANDFAIRAAPKLSPEERARYHIASRGDVRRMMEAGSPPLFVEGNWASVTDGKLLSQNGYRVTRTVGRARLWVREPGSTR